MKWMTRISQKRLCAQGNLGCLKHLLAQHIRHQWFQQVVLMFMPSGTKRCLIRHAGPHFVGLFFHLHTAKKFPGHWTELQRDVIARWAVGWICLMRDKNVTVPDDFRLSTIVVSIHVRQHFMHNYPSVAVKCSALTSKPRNGKTTSSDEGAEPLWLLKCWESLLAPIYNQGLRASTKDLSRRCAAGSSWTTGIKQSTKRRQCFTDTICEDSGTWLPWRSASPSAIHHGAW